MIERRLLTRIEYFIGQHQLIGAGQTIIVGLSGGPDSVFLLHMFYRLRPLHNLTLIAAHLDHGWRKNSHEDVLFCKKLCQSLGIEFVSVHADQLNHLVKKNGSQEDYGRQLRRAFFKSVAQTIKDSTGVEPLIALAHHQDDQVETFFIRLIRGAGLRGLACMKPKQDQYVRPLLCVAKAEILEYLAQHDIKYLIDETNTQDVYLRNRIRTSVVPALIAADKRFEVSCLRTIQHMQEVDDFLETLTAQTIESMTIHAKIHEGLDLKRFKQLHPVMQRRVLIAWLINQQVAFVPTESFFNEILRFLMSARGGKHSLNQCWSLVKKQNCMWVE